MDAARSAGVSLTLWLALLVPGTALAQAGNDPMRPPAGLGAGAADIETADTGGGMTLQSVMISPAGRAAIISGVMVKQGEKYGDAVLVKVAENEVVLKSGSDSQVLKLYPGVDKRVAAQAAAKSAPGKGKAAPR